MNGAIFFSGQYGSTTQYADWIGEATGLPVFDTKDRTADPSVYDFLVLGISSIVYKMTIRNWVHRNLPRNKDTPIILYTVSGASFGPELDAWVAQSLPESLALNMQKVALRDRIDSKKLSWWIRLILRIDAWKNDDPEAKREALEGLDYMDQSSIDPILKLVQQLQKNEKKAA